MSETTYDVRIWEYSAIKGKTRTTHRVRWVVGGKTWTKSFGTKQLAMSHRSKLLTAAREGQAFDVATGLPVSMVPKSAGVTWFDHAQAFASVRWPELAPRSRRSLAEGLTAVTPALLEDASDRPSDDDIRHTLLTYAFRASNEHPDETAARVLPWIEEHSLPLDALTDPTVTRRCLELISTTLDGGTAAPTTFARKRATLYGTLKYAVELGRLPFHPLDRVSWKRPRSTDAVDPASVVNPRQARALLTAVTYVDPAMEAFYALMYFAALRPAEAAHIKAADLDLPADGWGTLTLVGSTQRSGALWTDDGNAHEDRELKHRAVRTRRTVPASPDLCRTLRHHLDAYGTGPGGRLFVTRTPRTRVPLPGDLARPVSPSIYGRKWQRARAYAFPPEQVASPLAARPYDLRHACVSTWLAAGVSPAQVAQWAGHGVAVLLRTYTHAIDGGQAEALRRIDDQLGKRC
ncbi:MAG: hypothetical protein Q4G51_12260 [Dermatophilus congolensis]|nr:hypothetical protein [Dermatophilus congolensis]